MKKTTAIILLILVVAFTFTLVACNDNKPDPDSIVATFELDENDGLDNFTMRRGVIFQYKLAELKKINGIDAELNYDDKDGTVKIYVKNIDPKYLSAVLTAIGSEPELAFKSEHNADSQTLISGKGNIKFVKASLNSISNPSVQIGFTSAGVNAVNDNHGRLMYIFVGNEFCMNAKSNVLLADGDTATLTISSELNSLEMSTLVAAKMNAAVFGIKIKNMSIEYVG